MLINQLERIGSKSPSITKSFLRALHLLIFVYHLSNNFTTGQENDVRVTVTNITIPNIPTLSSFLEPCDIITLEERHCTEEEYESNEDCLPQKTDNCDHSKELFCLSGVCLPNCHPHKDTYDHIEGKCFRKVGSDCKSPEQSESESDPPRTVIVPPCEKNSVCERGQCRCAKDFTYDHNFNKCLLFAPYTGYCNETLNCDLKSDIECRENECQCKSPETQYFHLKRKRCYISIGQICSSGLQFCPDNSNCVKKSEEMNSSFDSDNRLYQLYQETLYQQQETEEHFIGILGEDEEKEFVCKCDKNYGSTKDKRFCLGLHGAWCNTLHRCNAERGLKCHEGTCLCDRVDEQVYSSQFQTCITLIGAPCLADGKGEREKDICPIGASCKDGHCLCDDDDELTASTLEKQDTSSVAFSCLKPHGKPCKNTSDPLEPPCNHEVRLECNHEQEKCLCKNPNQYYEEREMKCNDFRMPNEKIPVIHFTPPDDREYTFHSRNNCSKGYDYPFTGFTLILCILFSQLWE